MSWLKKNKLIVVLILLVFSGVTSYKYIYKPHNLIEDLPPYFTGKASSFIKKATNKNFNNWIISNIC